MKQAGCSVKEKINLLSSKFTGKKLFRRCLPGRGTGQAMCSHRHSHSTGEG